MKKSNLFSLAVLAMMFTVACSSEFKAARHSKATTENANVHQAHLKSVISTDTQLRNLEIDLTDLVHSKKTLDKNFIESKRQELEKISALLNEYIRVGNMMIDLGDNDESIVVTVENAKELKRMSTAYAITLSPEVNF